jgi:hypothetical protein
MNKPGESSLKVTPGLTVRVKDEIGLVISKPEWDYLKESIKGIKTDRELLDRQNFGVLCFSAALGCFLAGIGLLSQGLSIKDNGPLICLILMVAFLMGLACSFLFNRSDSNISENSKNQILGQMTLIETKYISNENETLACGILSTVSHTHALSTSHGSQSYSVVSPSHVHTIQNDRRYR